MILTTHWKIAAAPLAFALVLGAQGPSLQNAPLQFEVASIRPAGPIDTSGKMVTAGVKIDKDQFRANMMSVRDYLGIAYRLKIYQIDGPDWMASERYNINATIPAIAPEKLREEGTIAQMMKVLMEERFSIKSHMTKKDFPIYALVQTKEGIQAKASPLDAPERSVAIGGGGSAQGGFFSLGRGAGMAFTGSRMEAKKLSMTVLSETLGRFVDRPVLDQTGLTSTYDFDLEMSQEDFQQMMIRSAVAAGVALPPEAMKMLERPGGDSLHQALAKIGLKLEPKKAPMDVIVIDSISKAPSDN